MIDEKDFGKGAIREPVDKRDLAFDHTPSAEAPEVDWDQGYSVEEDLGFNLPFKNQGNSSSCVGQAWSYYVGVLDYIEMQKYLEVSAKSIYSQIFLENGGAYIRDGAKLILNWGALRERVLSSYKDGQPPDEQFMRETGWLNEHLVRKAKMLQAKEKRKIIASNDINLFARAVLENKGAVTGVDGANDGSWNTLEPRPPETVEWGHAIFISGFGRDSKGKYLLTPNSWGNRFNGKHQKIREFWFPTDHIFNAWVLHDKTNIMPLNIEDNKLYLLVEGKTQELAMGYKGKLMVYDKWIETIVNCTSRAGEWQEIIPVTLQQWNSVEKVDGKGNVIDG